jgi:hypothetical protein
MAVWWAFLDGLWTLCTLAGLKSADMMEKSVPQAYLRLLAGVRMGWNHILLMNEC